MARPKKLNCILSVCLAAFLGGCNSAYEGAALSESLSTGTPTEPTRVKVEFGPQPLNEGNSYPGFTSEQRLNLTPLARTGEPFNQAARPLWFGIDSYNVAAWQLDDAGAVAAGLPIGAASSNNWTLVGCGDFNADGISDILWQNKTTRALGLWYLNPAHAISGGAALPTPSTGWILRAVSDFDGDTKPDILWQNSTTGTLAYWRLNNANVVGASLIGENPKESSLGWTLRAAADFWNDGRSDLVWQNDLTGAVRIDNWRGDSYGPSALATGFPVGAVVKGAEDFDGDGSAEVLMQHPTSLEVGWAKRNGLGYQTIAVANSAWSLAGSLPPLQPGASRAAKPWLAAKSDSPQKIVVKWHVPAASTEIHIERSLDGLSWSEIAQVPATPATWDDTTVQAYSTYQYRAWCNLPSGNSERSVVSSARADYFWGGASTSSQNVAHTGENPDEKGRPPLRLHWTANMPISGPLSAAVVEDNQVITSTTSYYSNANAWGYNVDDGTLRWRHSFGSIQGVGWPSISDGLVTIQQSNSINGSYLFYLDASSGLRLNWIGFDNQGMSFRSPIQVGDRTFINAGYYGGIYGFSNSPLNRLFFQPLNQYDGWSPSYSRGQLYSFVAGAFTAHDRTTGATNWSTSVSWNWSGYTMNTDACIAPDTAFVVAPPVLYAIDLVSHATKWSHSLLYQGTPAFSDGIVYAIGDGQLLARDAATGAEKWIFVGDSRAINYPVIAGNTIYLATQNSVYAINKSTGQQQWSDIGSKGGILTVGSGHLFVAESTGKLRAYLLTQP